MHFVCFDRYFYNIFVKFILFFINFFYFCMAFLNNVCNNITHQ